LDRSYGYGYLYWNYIFGDKLMADEPVDITKILELKKINDYLGKSGLRTITMEELQEARKPEIVFDDPTSKGELVPFQEPKPEKGAGLLSVLKKAGRRLPGLGLLDILASNRPSQEVFEERLKKVQESPTLRKDPVGDIKSGLETVIDFVKGKNPPISRRDFGRGIRTAAQLAGTPNLSLKSGITPDEPLSRDDDLYDPTIHLKTDIIENALKSLPTTSIGRRLLKPSISIKDSHKRRMIDDIFDFSTETGEYNPNDERDGAIQRLRDAKTIDSFYINRPFSPSADAYTLSQIIGDYPDIETARRTVNFYDIEKDPVGTWKDYEELVQQVQAAYNKGDKVDHFRLKDELFKAWEKVKKSERYAENEFKEYLDDYFKNYESGRLPIGSDAAYSDLLGEGDLLEGYGKEYIFTELSPKQRTKMLEDREVAKQKRRAVNLEEDRRKSKDPVGDIKSGLETVIDFVTPSKSYKRKLSPTEIEFFEDVTAEGDNYDLLADGPSAKISIDSKGKKFLEVAEQDMDSFMNWIDNKYTKNMGYKDIPSHIRTGPKWHLTFKDEEGKNYWENIKKATGGVIRNPYPYTPRDI
jgi:hypothetical protein